VEHHEPSSLVISYGLREYIFPCLLYNFFFPLKRELEK